MQYPHLVITLSVFTAVAHHGVVSPSMVVQEVMILLLKMKGNKHCLDPWEQEANSEFVFVLLCCFDSSLCAFRVLALVKHY